MKKRRWSDVWQPVVLVLISLRCPAQDSFRYLVQVDTPARSDFYRIALSPEIVSHSQTDLSDLRILGPDGQFVPYVLKENATDTAGYQAIPEPGILRAENNNKQLIVTLSWVNAYRFDLLSFTVRSPTLYKRDARIFSKAGDGSWILLTPISIDPRHAAFRLPGVRTSGLKIEIDNADNPPLKVLGVSVKQAGLYLLTYLQAGTSYALLTANPRVRAPQYDLGYFTDTLKQRPQDIGLDSARETLVIAGSRDARVAASKEKPADRAGYVLWSILTTVLLLLIYFSVKMVRAIGTKKQP